MTMYKALYHWDDIDRLYGSKKGGRGLTSIQDSVDASIQWLEGYIKKCRGRLITVTRNNTNNTNIHWTKMGRKTTVWTFQVTKKWNLTWEDVDIAKKEKPLERNWISSNSSTKQHHKD